MYFCEDLRRVYQIMTALLTVSSTGFIAFTTIGYGDFAPVTPAGRAIFIFWALLGVGAMTVLIAGTSFDFFFSLSN